MSLADIDLPHWVSAVAAISWIRLLPVSAMYRSPVWLPAPRWMLVGWFSSAEVATPPSPLVPQLPVVPAMVYSSSAVIVMFHWVWLAAAISTTRQSPVSAMYRPEEFAVTPVGWFSRVWAAGVPLAVPVPCGK